jgi:REP element-mobilizing transposase RayT
MARGNARQQLFHADDDYQRMLNGLEKTVDRTGWEVFAFVWMPNHIHLFFRTPGPNLSQGMQYLLSGYANWYAKRHQRDGRLFQGRFRGELIEDETYFWNVSRYLHLNPVRGKRPLVKHPCDWRWSSYPGYARKSRRLAWMAYAPVWRAWRGVAGAKSPERAYQRFVEAGLNAPLSNPLAAAWEGWVLGSETFLKSIKRRLVGPKHFDEVPAARRLAACDPTDVIAAVALYYGQSPTAYQHRRSKSPGRDLAAYLAHRHTTATLRELAAPFGLRHPDSVSNLIRRAEQGFTGSNRLRGDRAQIEDQIRKTENRV